MRRLTTSTVRSSTSTVARARTMHGVVFMGFHVSQIACQYHGKWYDCFVLKDPTGLSNMVGRGRVAVQWLVSAGPKL
ncbi:hypothetical protein COCMIDRAFT_82766 [Bipolaris oryzae ATCC 44560]|uniref:Uncharacterized protein n=1 Tax=Bipolaris oryzae ATCC 44560 TaxID=930090 RepID=W7A277_COCMI|nr:uncharacterized protein COCMIDRAFT_82766 [Bipolaris oryzae ATCC 44560]EUC50126.1 hypothetical protein COCMIDRAFT_82766 [Bipolaris oryzae ATCC 44560]